MPSIRDSQDVDRSNLEAVTGEAAPAQFSRPAPPSGFARSPFMVSSLPPLAAGYDQYVRQFYDPAPYPWQRVLPIGIS